VRSPKRIMPKGTQSYDTEIEIPITVEYSMNAPEPDVGYDGGIEIEGVYVGGVVLNLSESMIDALAEEINESHISAYEAACDNAYDESREER
jgi:hypothetical protein